jgi:CubicO group peptidase (beta-lactamase class C family)
VNAAVTGLDEVLSEELATWPAGPAGAAVIGSSGPLTVAGDDGPFPWASVTKILTSLTILDATRDGTVDLDDHAGPPGATVRHLLAHASGVARDSDKAMAPPGARRIYSNRGMEILGEHLERHTGRPFETELHERVLVPLQLSATRLHGSPAHGASGSVSDLARLAGELLLPRWFPASLLASATTTSFPGLDGLLPGFGVQSPNDWGLGFEVRGHKSPHWTSPVNSPSTFGHFGQSGSFVWVDPEAGLACVGAGDIDFGAWAAEAWPRLSTRVLRSVLAKDRP